MIDIQVASLQFRQAMQAAGIDYSGEIIADGQLHRFYIEGNKPGTKNGAYVLHADRYPAGWFMDYRNGINQTWKFNGGTGSCISNYMQGEIEKAKRERDEEIRQKHEAAASRAVHIWRKSASIAKQEDHAYLAKKRIHPHRARLFRDALVIPLMNESRKIVNLQFIDKDGNKHFLSGGQKKGCFHPIGQPTSRILICEGFATGASLYEEAEQCTIVAFDAGNLKPVAEVIRALFPVNEIIIAGDNDLTCIGQCAARKAAVAINALVLIPNIPGMDWNDVLKGGGHD